MNTEIYSWQNEKMVALEMENYRREIESIRLIREAVLSNPGWVERTFIAVGNALVHWGSQLRKNYTALLRKTRIAAGDFPATP